MSSPVEQRLVLPGEATSARVARRFVVDVLASWSLTDLRETVELLTCELVTNVVLHVRGELTLRLLRLPDKLRVEVNDPEPATPSAPTNVAGEEAHTTGRGLALVDALSSAWGVEPASGGKTIWFEVAVEEAA
jgi:anti-sigma regulatory factor (Ser/Thr protein kinase)